LTTSLIIPWRDKGDARRLDNFQYVARNLWAQGWYPFDVSDGGDGPFNRSRAYNRGRAAHPADVYVWHEADMIVPPDQLERAIELALEAPGLVVPFTEYHMTNPEQATLVHGGADVTSMDCNVIYWGQSIGAVGVTSEATMRLVGQWDEMFDGWGFDDNAMFHAFKLCAGEPRWVDGPGYHLWHPSGAGATTETEQNASARNQARLQTYLREMNPKCIRDLTGQVTG
jgi:hypothetical protein